MPPLNPSFDAPTEAATKAARSGLFTSMLAPGERPELAVRSGRGMELTLADGRTVLDAGSLSSCLFGHCHPAIVEAVQRAASIVYVNDATGYGPRQSAGDELLKLAFADEPWADAVVFTVSSSEASDLGLLLAQMLTGREALVCRQLGYHGGVGLGREVSTHPLWSAGLLDPLSDRVTLPRRATTVRELPVPSCGRTLTLAPEHDCAADCLADAPGLLRDAAAVIMDYSQGGIVPSARYQDTLARVANDAGALWIADETVTGLGRIGHMFAFQRGDSRPDMVVLGKGITGGAAPGGALVLSRRVVEAIGHRRWMTSSTFRGHPLAVAAVSAALRTLVTDELVDRAQANGEMLAKRLTAVVSDAGIARGLWGEGQLWFIELDAAHPYDEAVWRGGGGGSPITTVVQRASLEHGVLVGSYSGNLLWLIPPLIANREQLGHVCDALAEGLNSLSGLGEAATQVAADTITRRPD